MRSDALRIARIVCRAVFLQGLLNQRGAAVTVDGDFGTQTDGAVTNFQRTNGLAVDGIVGNQTWGALCNVVNSPPPAVPTVPVPPVATGVCATKPGLRRGSAGSSVRELQVCDLALIVVAMFLLCWVC